MNSKLFHKDEAAARELVAHGIGDLISEDDDSNIFTDTGWFQLDATVMPSAEDLELLRKNVGDAGALSKPSHWNDVIDPTVVQCHKLKKGSAEFNVVVGAFLSTLRNRKITHIKVERVQNLAMWQSYVVKRQTICYRETGLHGIGDEEKEEEKVDSFSMRRRKALERFERHWLWHGTNAEVKDKILQQGFNRSFCGRNATMYGKGTCEKSV